MLLQIDKTLNYKVVCGYDERLTADYILSIITGLREAGVTNPIEIANIYKNRISIPDPESDDTILFTLLDEFNQIYRYEGRSKYKLIVTSQGTYHKDNIHAIPMGYCRKPSNLVRNTNKTGKVFFAGWKNNRSGFIQDVSHYPEGQDIVLNDKWGSGLSTDEYFSHMSDSTYALCPLGAMSPCYRLYEAYMCGSIPITTINPWSNILPGMPFIKVDTYDWDTVSDAIMGNHITNDDIYQYYDKFMSESAVINSILGRL